MYYQNHNNIKGILFIVFGAVVILLTAADLVIKLAGLAFGLYLIYQGLKLRNAHKILFFFNRFKDRF